MEGLRGRRGHAVALALAASLVLGACGSSVADRPVHRGLPGDRAPAVQASSQVLGASAPPASVAGVAGLLLSTLPGGH